MSQPTVFIHGILRRSGTNFLNQLLLLHPLLEQSQSKIRENWFLHYSDHLKSYYDNLNTLWSNSKWLGEPFSKNDFFKEIGKGQLTYLKSFNAIDPEIRLLTKTPSVKNIDQFSIMFPEAKNIILVRNPYDVAASSYKTWGNSVGNTINEWNKGVREIYNYELKNEDSDYLLLRYEDLLSKPQHEINKCLKYLGLDESLYNWNTMDELPIFGSSESGSDFSIQKKTDNFNPLHRWKYLPEEQQKILETGFNQKCAGYLGYKEDGTVVVMPEKESRLQLGSKLSDSGMKSEEKPALKLSRFHHCKNGLKSFYYALKW